MIGDIFGVLCWEFYGCVSPLSYPEDPDIQDWRLWRLACLISVMYLHLYDKVETWRDLVGCCTMHHSLK